MDLVKSSKLLEASKNNAEPMIIVSHGVTPLNKNPLQLNKKVEILRKMFPGITITHTGGGNPTSIVSLVGSINGKRKCL